MALLIAITGVNVAFMYHRKITEVLQEKIRSAMSQS